MTEMKTPGRIVWHELMSDDVPGSIAFYSALFGWQTNAVDMGGPAPYQMIQNGEATIGGFMAKHAEDPSPCHWVAYTNVPDVDAAVATALANGGSAPVPAMEVPDVGRFAIIRDPQGGLISAWRGSGEEAPELTGPAPAGAFCWDELVTTDAEAAKAFYSALFGWSPAPMDPENPDRYTFFMRGGDKCEAAMMPIPAEVENPQTAWIAYVAVTDLDASAARAEELGAITFVPPSEIPGYGHFSVLRDPQGANFAMYQAPATPPEAPADPA